MHWTIRQHVDLKQPHRDFCPGGAALMEPGDGGAHVWEVELTDGGEAVDLSSVEAFGEFERPDGAAVVVAGECEGNVARVTLTKECCALPGDLRGALRLTAKTVNPALLTDAGDTLTAAETRFFVREAFGGTFILPEGEVRFESEAGLVAYRGRRFYDVTATTATADDVRKGKLFFDAGGTLTTGAPAFTVYAGDGAAAALIEDDDYLIAFEAVSREIDIDDLDE